MMIIWRSKLPEFVWYRGKIWRHVNKGIWRGGRIALESLSVDGSGVSAPLRDCHPASEEEVGALAHFRVIPCL